MQSEINQHSLFICPIIKSHRDVYDHFSCNNGSIDRFLKTDAFLSHVNKEASTSLVFIDGVLVGYFTLKHVEMEFQIENADNEKVACLEIAKLGVIEDRQKQGIGKAIVDYIIESAYMFNERYIIGFALTERIDWYRRHFGFQLIGEEEQYENDSGEPVAFIYLNLEFPDLREGLINNP